LKLWYWLRVNLKLLKSKFFLVPSFCKVCGRDVHDFEAPDDIWGKVEKTD